MTFVNDVFAVAAQDWFVWTGVSSAKTVWGKIGVGIWIF
jgi:ribosomal protein S3